MQSVTPAPDIQQILRQESAAIAGEPPLDETAFEAPPRPAPRAPLLSGPVWQAIFRFVDRFIPDPSAMRTTPRLPGGISLARELDRFPIVASPREVAILWNTDPADFRDEELASLFPDVGRTAAAVDGWAASLLERYPTHTIARHLRSVREVMQRLRERNAAAFSEAPASSARRMIARIIHDLLLYDNDDLAVDRRTLKALEVELRNSAGRRERDRARGRPSFEPPPLELLALIEVAQRAQAIDDHDLAHSILTELLLRAPSVIHALFGAAVAPTASWSQRWGEEREAVIRDGTMTGTILFLNRRQLPELAELHELFRSSGVPGSYSEVSFLHFLRIYVGIDFDRQSQLATPESLQRTAARYIALGRPTDGLWAIVPEAIRLLTGQPVPEAAPSAEATGRPASSRIEGFVEADVPSLARAASDAVAEDPDVDVAAILGQECAIDGVAAGGLDPTAASTAAYLAQRKSPPAASTAAKTPTGK